jgi:hypothetical protein
MKKFGVVVFAFGLPSSLVPNQILANVAVRNALDKKADIFAQPYTKVRSRMVHVDYTEEPDNKPLSTLQVARAAVDWAERNHLTDIEVVAAKPHLPRVMRDLRNTIAEKLSSIRICPARQMRGWSDRDVWFSESSLQPWTRNAVAWDRRERILLLMPFWFYRRITA